MSVSGLPSPYEPASGPRVSEHSRAVALGLAVMGGWFGLHRFYVGRIKGGICWCCTAGGLFIGNLYDIVLIALGEFRDGDGRRVSRWEVADASVGGSVSGAERRVADVEDRMLSLETQVSELAERLDFTERMLAKVRERGSLPKG
ncbi:MAG TPA: TM2 domain-containing protein [Gemmatimonadales bacterium]|nr:TM2 domain-containing protein [Gemmatimonadales bacterium]